MLYRKLSFTMTLGGERGLTTSYFLLPQLLPTPPHLHCTEPALIILVFSDPLQGVPKRNKQAPTPKEVLKTITPLTNVTPHPPTPWQGHAVINESPTGHLIKGNSYLLNNKLASSTLYNPIKPLTTIKPLLFSIFNKNKFYVLCIILFVFALDVTYIKETVI